MIYMMEVNEAINKNPPIWIPIRLSFRSPKSDGNNWIKEFVDIFYIAWIKNMVNAAKRKAFSMKNMYLINMSAFKLKQCLDSKLVN